MLKKKKLFLFFISANAMMQRNMVFLSTSAKTGENVEEAFVTLARRILQAGEETSDASTKTKSHRLTVSFSLVGRERRPRKRDTEAFLFLFFSVAVASFHQMCGTIWYVYAW